MNLFRIFFSYDHIKSIEVPKYYHLIDCFRTFAALAVVFHHYQHFYFFGGSKIQVVTLLQQTFPSSHFIKISIISTRSVLLECNFFGVISGFIFASVYFSRKVQEKSSLLAGLLDYTHSTSLP